VGGGRRWLPYWNHYWQNDIDTTFDRPYHNRWGAHFAWTHAKATQTGNDLFSLDFPSAASYPRHAVPGSERDRIVATGIFGLPYDVKLSSILSFGSGGAANLLDFSQGFSLANRQASHAYAGTLYPPKTWGFADRCIDFRLEKSFHVYGPASVAVIGEIFNAFDFHNFGCLNNFLPPEGNPSLGQPNCMVNLGRREQLGLRVQF
jgi:hypothetical protein